MNEADWLLAVLRGICVLATVVGVVALTNKTLVAFCAGTFVWYLMMHAETLAKLVAP